MGASGVLTGLLRGIDTSLHGLRFGEPAEQRHYKSEADSWCVEMGAGGVLTGLLRGIDPALAGLRFGEPEELAALQN